jgi:hypothetical protein
VLPRFLAAVAQRPSPVLLDLGPVVGANVTFFGERLGCRLLIGDLHADLDRSRGKPPQERAEAIVDRLHAAVHTPLDGVLCWDTFDYFDRATASAVAGFLVDHLSPGGVLHGLFGTEPAEIDCRTRYVLQSPSSLICRHESAAPFRRVVLTTRDLAVMFPGTKVTESVLLKTRRREILLRKA